MWRKWATVLAALGFGGVAVAEQHMVVVMRVELLVAHPSQPAPWPGQGWSALAQRHTVVVLRVDHLVAHPRQQPSLP